MGIETKYREPIGGLLNWTDWTVSSGSIAAFSQNGDTAENVRELGNDPWGKEIILWTCVPDIDSDADGGWGCNNMEIDNTELYRLSCWFKRTGTNAGSTYLGTYGRNSGGTNIGVYNVDDDVLNTNPYFWSGDFTSLDTWYLVVGHIFPDGYSGGVDHADSGIYTIDGYDKATGRDYYWHPDNAKSTHRAYLYYCITTTNRQYIAYPRFDLCDGNEPSIGELLLGLDSRTYDYVEALDGGYANAGVDKNGTWWTHEFSEVGVTDGLTGYWTFNNESLDWSGSRNNATLNGVTYDAGIKGPGAYFDGTVTNDIEIGTMSDYKTASLSISICAKLEDWDSRHLLFVNWAGYTLEPSDSGTNWRWNGGIYTTSGQEMFNPSNTYSYGAWHQIGFTFDDVTKIGKAYADGEYIGQNTFTGSIDYGSSSLKIGNDSYGSMKGWVDEARYYDRVLTDAEMKTLYNLSVGNSMMELTLLGETYLRGKLHEI